MCAMITLQTVHLAPTSKLDDQLVLDLDQSVSIRAHTGNVPESDGGETTVTVTIESATRSTRDKLRRWVGQELLYRDWAGRLLYGAISSLDVSEQPGLDRCSLSFNFTGNNKVRAV